MLSENNLYTYFLNFHLLIYIITILMICLVNIGSERLAMSGAEGSTLVETQNINLSLTALGFSTI